MDETCSPDQKGRTAFRDAIEAWGQEVDRLDAQIRDESTAVLARLEDCHSPLDVLSVEKVWLSVRSRAYFASSFTFAHAFGKVARAFYAGQPRV